MPFSSQQYLIETEILDLVDLQSVSDFKLDSDIIHTNPSIIIHNSDADLDEFLNNDYNCSCPDLDSSYSESTFSETSSIHTINYNYKLNNFEQEQDLKDIIDVKGEEWFIDNMLGKFNSVSELRDIEIYYFRKMESLKLNNMNEFEYEYENPDEIEESTDTTASSLLSDDILIENHIIDLLDLQSEQSSIISYKYKKNDNYIKDLDQDLNDILESKGEEWLINNISQKKSKFELRDIEIYYLAKIAREEQELNYLESKLENDFEKLVENATKEKEKEIHNHVNFKDQTSLEPSSLSSTITKSAMGIFSNQIEHFFRLF